MCTTQRASILQRAGRQTSTCGPLRGTTANIQTSGRRPWNAVLKEINRTGKPRLVPKGGEDWKESHGYYDGLWWRGASPPEQLGFVEGYLSCYSTEMPSASGMFSKSAPDYVRLMNSYMKGHAHSDEEKLADILSRFRDRQAQQ